MQLTVTCDGVPVGHTDLRAGSGLRAGHLTPLPAYGALGTRDVARRLGVALLLQAWRRVRPPAAARALAAADAAAEALMPRLDVRDGAGVAAPVVRLYLVELPRRARHRGPFVVADLGEAGAGRGATPRRPLTPAAETSRPAA